MSIVRVRIDLPDDADEVRFAYSLAEWLEAERNGIATLAGILSDQMSVRTAYRTTRISSNGLRTIRCWEYVGGKQDTKGNR